MFTLFIRDLRESEDSVEYPVSRYAPAFPFSTSLLLTPSLNLGREELSWDWEPELALESEAVNILKYLMKFFSSAH